MYKQTLQWSSCQSRQDGEEKERGYLQSEKISHVNHWIYKGAITSPGMSIIVSTSISHGIASVEHLYLEFCIVLFLYHSSWKCVNKETFCNVSKYNYNTQ